MFNIKDIVKYNKNIIEYSKNNKYILEFIRTKTPEINENLITYEKGNYYNFIGLYFYYYDKNIFLGIKLLNISIKYNNSNSYSILGMHYYNEENFNKFIEYTLQSLNIDKNNDSALYNLGLYYLNININAHMMKYYFVEAIKLNNEYAKISLASYYLNKEQNTLLMKQYLYLAIRDNKSCSAMYKLGMYFLNNKKINQGLKYLLMASKMNYIPANFILSIHYKNAPKESLYLYKNVKLQNCLAMYKLGLYYKTNENYFEMVKYFLFGVKYSNATCMYELGMYYKSINVIYLMLKYLRMGADLNHLDSIIVLSQYYINTKTNLDLAEKYLLIAVNKHKSPLAMNETGFLYYNLLNNPEEASKYYLMAIEKNYTISMSNYGQLLFRHYKDYDKAVKYYLMACNNGSVGGAHSLAYYYLTVNANYDLAIMYYKLGYKFICEENSITKNLNFIKLMIADLKEKNLQPLFCYEVCKKYNITEKKIEIKAKNLLNKAKFKSGVIESECPICYDTTTLYIYECFSKHYYCENCIYNINKCSMCRVNPNSIY